MAKIKIFFVFLHFKFNIVYRICRRAGIITKTDNYDEKVDGILGGDFRTFS